MLRILRKILNEKSKRYQNQTKPNKKPDLLEMKKHYLNWEELIKDQTQKNITELEAQQKLSKLRPQEKKTKLTKANCGMISTVLTYM